MTELLSGFSSGTFSFRSNFSLGASLFHSVDLTVELQICTIFDSFSHNDVYNWFCC